MWKLRGNISIVDSVLSSNTAQWGGGVGFSSCRKLEIIRSQKQKIMPSIMLMVVVAYLYGAVEQVS